MSRPEPTPSTPGGPCTGLDTESLAVLAHELRGALTVISGYSELLGRRLSADERDQAVAGIGRAIARADSLLAEALRAERARTDAVPITDLALVAEQVAAEQRAATGRRIVVTSDAHPHVAADADALARAVANLVSNAAKYSPAEAPIDLRVATDGSRAAIEVSDRGPGIPPAEKDALFEPFARLARDEAAPGTGLGLTVVKRVAEAAGGQVALADRDGGGTTARMTLPVIEP